MSDTPETWEVVFNGINYNLKGARFINAVAGSRSDAEYICKRLNACSKLTDEELEACQDQDVCPMFIRSLGLKSIDYLKRLNNAEAQNARLVEALEKLHKYTCKIDSAFIDYAGKPPEQELDTNPEDFNFASEVLREVRGSDGRDY